MLPDALPQLMDTLLRLPHLDAAQLRELIAHLPDPQSAAQEMVCRGWITRDQFSRLFPDQQRPTQATMLPGFPDPGCEDWHLPLGDEEGKADKRPRQWMGWASKVLLLGTLFVGSFFAVLPFFTANSTAPPVARQDSKKARDLPPAAEIVYAYNPKQRDELLNNIGKYAPPPVPLPDIPAIYAEVAKALTNQARDVNCTASRQTLLRQPTAPQAPVPVRRASPDPAATPDRRSPKAPAPATDTKPIRAASLYDRVRQAVLENKTEETQRLGIGDFAYQHVPVDGSIMVGMEVTYVPFFTHNVIKSVRPIYQRADGTRYDGPVCGNPTATGERVVAAPGYAIGGAAIWSGMGIDGIQLTFMEIGADELNTRKTYLSKWLGGYGGANAKTFVNDGRPIVGIAGMVSKLSFGPAFCMCLITTSQGAITAADGPGQLAVPIRQREASAIH